MRTTIKMTEETGGSSEWRAVLEFCQSQDGELTEEYSRLQKCLTEVCGQQANLQTSVICIINILEEEQEEERLFRALLLLENLVHRAVLTPTKIVHLYNKVSEKLIQSPSKKVSTKAKKISLILTSLTTPRT